MSIHYSFTLHSPLLAYEKAETKWERIKNLNFFPSNWSHNGVDLSCKTHTSGREYEKSIYYFNSENKWNFMLPVSADVQLTIFTAIVYDRPIGRFFLLSLCRH